MTLRRAIRCRGSVQSTRKGCWAYCGHGRGVLEAHWHRSTCCGWPRAHRAPVRTLRVRAAAPNLSMGEEALGVERLAALEHEVHGPGKFRSDDRQALALSVLGREARAQRLRGLVRAQEAH